MMLDLMLWKARSNTWGYSLNMHSTYLKVEISVFNYHNYLQLPTFCLKCMHIHHLESDEICSKSANFNALYAWDGTLDSPGLNLSWNMGKKRLQLSTESGYENTHKSKYPQLLATANINIFKLKPSFFPIFTQKLIELEL